jgi:outer membrane protein assembly factor BamB
VIWTAGDRRSSYATPVLTTLAGTEQVIVVNEDFVTSHRAEDGVILWEHPWPGRSDGNASTSQPVPVGDDRVFLSKGYGIGSELIQVLRDGQQLYTDTIWQERRMKTKMCNVVIRDGFVYGLDDVNLQCIELATGKRRWKKRRQPSFGHGQVLLVGAHLLVLSEEGEVILAAVDPHEYRELAHFSALEGVTWNNPTLVGSRLLVRNAEWAACFELPLEEPGSEAVPETN